MKQPCPRLVQIAFIIQLVLSVVFERSLPLYQSAVLVSSSGLCISSKTVVCELLMRGKRACPNPNCTEILGTAAKFCKGCNQPVLRNSNSSGGEGSSSRQQIGLAVAGPPSPPAVVISRQNASSTRPAQRRRTNPTQSAPQDVDMQDDYDGGCASPEQLPSLFDRQTDHLQIYVAALKLDEDSRIRPFAISGEGVVVCAVADFEIDALGGLLCLVRI